MFVLSRLLLSHLSTLLLFTRCLIVQVLNSLSRPPWPVVTYVLWAFALFLPASSSAAIIALAWNPSSSPDIAGYMIHYGVTSENYPFTVDVGENTTGTVPDLEPGKTYYFSATAYDSSRRESGFSNEVSFSVAAPSSPHYSLAVIQTGSGSGTVTTTPAGTSFTAGTGVTLTATSGYGSTFAGWSGACAGISLSCMLTINQSVEVTAAFNPTGSSNIPDGLNWQGHPYIFWHHQTRGDVFVWYLNGAAFAWDQRIAVVDDLNWQIAGVADFNQDGSPDILWHHQTQGHIYVWFMDGPNFVRDQYIGTVGGDLNWQIAGVADFNQDGSPDILWHHQTQGHIYVWFMDGPNFVRDQYIGTVGDDLNWKIAGVGDFDGDGKPEILWHHQTGGYVYIWFMDGAAFSYDRHVRTVGDDLNWKIEGIGDFNGDGKADILWRHQLRGDVYVWLMDGANFVADQYIRSVNGTPDELNWRIVN